MIKQILFNTGRVKSILENMKTITRRPAKKIPVETHRVEPLEDGTFECFWGGYQTDAETFVDGSCIVTPPYKPGDILYVRETIWQKIYCYLDVDGETKPTFCNEFKYVASDEKPEVGWNYSWAKRPSIHMPKAAARIWLKVTDVRVEQLKDITEEQAIKEGYVDDIEYALGHTAAWHFTEDFKNIYPDCTEDSWVWVIEFRKCEKPEMR